MRRVPTLLPNYVKSDGSITSMAFKSRRDSKGLSVDLERLSSYAQITLGRTDFRVLRVNVDIIRHQIDDGLDVKHDPIEENVAHSLIIGDINKTKQKLLLLNSTEISVDEKEKRPLK